LFETHSVHVSHKVDDRCSYTIQHDDLAPTVTLNLPQRDVDITNKWAHSLVGVVQ